MPPRDVSYFLKEWGIGFPSSSHTVPIKFFLFPSVTHQNPFVIINFPLFPSTSFCSHQVPKKFPLFPLSSHQNPFVPMALEDRQMSTDEHEGER
jgi:hypothetical protein